MLAEAEALMAEIGSGDFKARQAKKAAEAVKQSEAGLATQGLKLRCDVNGCVIVPINANEYTPGLTGKQHSRQLCPHLWGLTWMHLSDARSPQLHACSLSGHSHHAV